MLAYCQSSFGWGKIGHATIATIAEDHLNPKTKKIISEYLDGKSIVDYASYADKHRSELLVDIGFEPNEGSRVTTYPHSLEADMNCIPFVGTNDNGRPVRNCVHFINKMTDELKDHKRLSDSLRFHNIVMIVHFVGDMHCPEHIRYYPDDTDVGKYDITFNGNATTMHKLWDTAIITSIHKKASPREIASSIDNCTKNEIKKFVSGKTYDWAADCAKVSQPVHTVPAGATLTTDYARENQPLVEQQLLKAGYRLAELLNKTLR